MPLPTCVSPEGRFIFGIHKPLFKVANQREHDLINNLGQQTDGKPIDNLANFPGQDLEIKDSSWIFEIPNPFSFRGTTFIKKDWADKRAIDPSSIKLPPLPEISLSASMSKIIGSHKGKELDQAFRILPQPALLAIATTSTDPDDLVRLAEIACSFVTDKQNKPTGLYYESGEGQHPRPIIHDLVLFETVVNNPCLPDQYKKIMVLKPGVQGTSEIVGEYLPDDHSSHVFEYLRRNSYIAGGHYAANMADDATRYSITELSDNDMAGLRHLYYQRTFLRMADQLGIDPQPQRQTLTESNLETLRIMTVRKLKEKAEGSLEFNATLWGWNYGFDFAPSHYRLHASHQQIHQQFAMLPGKIAGHEGSPQPAYGCGNLVEDCINRFRTATGRNFFDCYLSAISTNTRTDGNNSGPCSLIIHQDENIILFVPKAQTSQWELQLICRKQVGNIVEADTPTRKSLDSAILVAMKTLNALGARMVTTIEFPKRFDSPDRDQRLLYSFLPKLPESPGAFSEAQLRWINGHYPEDFAEACRQAQERTKI